MTAKPKAGKAALQRMLDAEEFIRPWRFRIVSVGDGTVTVVIPLRKALLRPGGIVNGPALMAAADVVLWLAIKARHGIGYDALTSDLNTAFLRPAKNVPVYCTGRILRAGRRRDRAGAESDHRVASFAQASIVTVSSHHSRSPDCSCS